MAATWYSDELPAATPLHRYIGRARFDEIAENRALWFTRLDDYHDGELSRRDPWEGRHTRRHWEYFRTMVAGAANERESLEHLARVERSLWLRTAVSCWTLAPVETTRAWRKWGDAAETVRLSTTVGRLLGAVGEHTQLAVGSIRYIEHERDWPPIDGDPVRLTFVKERAEYEWESEFRLAIAPGPLLGGPELSERYVRVPLATTEWLSEVRVHPAATPQQLEGVARVVARFYSPRVRVARSSLARVDVG